MTFAKISLKSIMYYTKDMVLGSLTLLLCIAMIAVPRSSSRGVAQGLEYCLNILVPSLFPFMFMASYIVKSGLFRKFQKVLSYLTEFMFYLPGCTAPTIILSLIGGYPVGARGVKSLLENKEINSEQSNRMMCFCVNAGPAFIMGVVGGALLHDPFTGMLMFTVQVIVSLFTGVLCAAKARANKKPFYSKKENSSNIINSTVSEAIVNSCEEASKSILGMCALVVIFSAIISILQDFNILNLISDNFIKFGIPRSGSLTLLTSFLEITSGCAQASHLNAAPAIISFAIGYGGLCVHLQIASILNQTGFNYRKFCTFRFLNATTSAILTYVCINVFEKSELAFSTINCPVFISNSSTAHGSIALIALCLFFIFIVNAKTLKTKAKKS